MERIISQSSAKQSCLSVIPSPPAGPSEPAGHQRSRDGVRDGYGPPSSQVMCPHGTLTQLSAPSEGGPSLPDANTTPARDPGLSPCPGSTAEARQPLRRWQGAR